MNRQNFKEYYPFESIKLEQTINKIIQVFKNYGYLPIEPSTFINYSLTSIIDGKNSFKLIDSDGTVLSLRTEYTLKVSEIISKYFYNNLPMRVYYSGKAYQYLTDNAGDLREYYQTGIEKFDTNYSIDSDVEILIIAIESLLSLGLSNWTLDIGDVNFFKGFAYSMNIDEEHFDILRKLIDKKDYIGIENFSKKYELSKEALNIFRKLARLYGKEDIFYEAKKIANNHMSLESIERLEYIYNSLEKVGYHEYITLDFGMLKSLNYYTGLIFTGYIEGLGYPILSGGRYDNLCSSFDCKLSACGFAIGLDRLLNILEYANHYYEYIIAYEGGRFIEALSEIKKSEGKALLLSDCISIEEVKKKAKLNNIKKIIYIKNDGVICVLEV